MMRQKWTLALLAVVVMSVAALACPASAATITPNARETWQAIPSSGGTDSYCGYSGTVVFTDDNHSASRAFLYAEQGGGGLRSGRQ